ncbi:hypothetical protein RvY_07450 [Ramazzottius varieornatus]|uniref:WAP domain-containing protein n=1 Tax=Ramazzottius varieornatus TaxID=947166 RepID=A0A1D1V2G3_RAMVA|nr:hypothetical protein RvY_07450 [Ramazzottius varieornatus]
MDISCLNLTIFTIAMTFLLTLCNGQRAGICPSGGPGNGAAQCNYDNMCPYPQKCCPIGATGFSYCANPIGGNTGYTNVIVGTPNYKRGYCPNRQYFVNCYRATYYCNNDYNCAGNLKCCSNGCGRQCTSPYF